MATYEISDPQGNKYRVTAPDAASQDDVLKYAQANFDKSASAAPSLPSEIGSDVSGYVKGITDYLNPFSEARHASYAKQANAPIGEALTENIRQLEGTGSALAKVAPFGIAPKAMAIGTGIALGGTPLLSRGFQAINQAAGIDLPYAQAKEQTELALAGTAPKGHSPMGARPEMIPALQPQQLKDAGTAVFNDPNIKSIPVPATDVNLTTGAAKADLMQRGFRNDPRSADATFRELDYLQSKTGAQGTERATPINIDDLRSTRMTLSKYAQEMTSAANGPPRRTPNAEAAQQALGHVDELINSIDPRVAIANADYSAGLAAEGVDYRKGTAARRAAKTGSGSNIENTMRQEVDKIPGRGLTPEERALKEKIVTGSFARNTARKIGKVGFGDSLSFMYHTALAIPSAGTLPLIGVGATGVRKIGEALTRRKIGQLSEMIRSRAPASIASRAPYKQSKISAAIAAALMGNLSGQQ